MAMKRVQELQSTKPPKGKGKGKASGKGQLAAAGAKKGALTDQTNPLMQGAWLCSMVLARFLAISNPIPEDAPVINA